MANSLIILLGPTAVGKTEESIVLAKTFNSDIISADSRQIYREMPIGTAMIQKEDMCRIRHYFVASHSINDKYGSYDYEQDVINLLPTLFTKSNIQIMTGGSMMYIDAVCNGIDDIPNVNPTIREHVYYIYHKKGLNPILSHLKQLDPIYYERVDKNNYKRILHGYEICLSTGRAYSSYLTGEKKQRDFNIIKIGLYRDRKELFERINSRVDVMIKKGLEQECRNLYPFRHLNALNTVGYKEFFSYFDGVISKDKAIQLIKKHTRVYARKQQTWWRKDSQINWFEAGSINNILNFLEKHLS